MIPSRLFILCAMGLLVQRCTGYIDTLEPLEPVERVAEVAPVAPTTTLEAKPGEPRVPFPEGTTRSCPIVNGAGVQTVINGQWSACVVGSCASGFVFKARNNTCVPVTRGCSPAHGSGIETLAGASFGACVVESCWSGWSLDPNSNVCFGTHETSLAISASRIAPGNSVTLTWNGGPRAHGCTFFISNAAQVNYQPFGLLPPSGTTRIDAIASSTQFNLQCLDSGGGYLPNNAVARVVVEASPALEPQLSYLSRLGLSRAALWSKTTGDWEVWWDGVGSPLDGAPTSHWWDNAIDDDWNEPRVVANSFSFDNPSPGFWTVDRHTDMADWNKGGVISRRDEFLHTSYGLTIEFRARIFPDSGVFAPPGSSVVTEHNAFSVHYMREDGVTATVFLTPTRLKVGGRYLAPDQEIPFDTTGFNTYRLVQRPNENAFSVYVNDSPTAALVGVATAQIPVASVTDREHPTIIVGGEGVYRSHFVLDFVRYRRGAYAPGASMPPPLTRLAPKLPEPLPANALEGFLPGFDSTHFYSDPYALFGPLRTLSQNGQSYLVGCSAGFVKGADGNLEYSGVTSPTCFVPAMPGITGRGDVTIEARVKVLPDSGTRGFSIFYSDEMGTHGIVFSKDKVETVLGIKNIGYHAVAMDLTNGYHTFRLVRPAHQLYAHLYIDDGPIPLIVDQHADASTGLALLRTNGFLEFGHAFNPGPGKGHLLIEYIRWAPTAYAPPMN